MSTATEHDSRHTSSAGSASGGSVGDSLARLGEALARRAVNGAAGKVGSLTDGLSAFTDGKGGSGAATAVSGLAKAAKVAGGAQGLAEKVGLTGGGGAGDGPGRAKGGSLKMTTIIESIDVGVPVDVAYDQWTRFTDFPSFMKKVENVEQDEDEKLTWRAQVFWSHRTWTSTILEQVPDERIVWRSSGDKGFVDGAVSFHELTPDLTRIMIVLEYHPKGFFEHVGNLWRAQGRRARLELKHFQRQVMTETALHTDELEGWRGEIHDGEVTTPEELEDRGGGSDPEEAAAEGAAESDGEEAGSEPAAGEGGSGEGEGGSS